MAEEARARSGFDASDFDYTAELLTEHGEAVRDATLSNNFNIILAALRTAADAERDYADMRRMQAKFIAADQSARALQEALQTIVEMSGDQPARSAWNMVHLARAALSRVSNDQELKDV